MGGKGPEKTREVGCFQCRGKATVRNTLGLPGKVRSIEEFFEVFISAIITYGLEPPIIKGINILRLGGGILEVVILKVRERDNIDKTES